MRPAAARRSAIERAPAASWSAWAAGGAHPRECGAGRGDWGYGIRTAGGAAGVASRGAGAAHVVAGRGSFRLPRRSRADGVHSAPVRGGRVCWWVGARIHDQLTTEHRGRQHDRAAERREVEDLVARVVDLEMAGVVHGSGAPSAREQPVRRSSPCWSWRPLLLRRLSSGTSTRRSACGDSTRISSAPRSADLAIGIRNASPSSPGLGPARVESVGSPVGDHHLVGAFMLFDEVTFAAPELLVVVVEARAADRAVAVASLLGMVPDQGMPAPVADAHRHEV
jgi:hypothetical protein